MNKVIVAKVKGLIPLFLATVGVVSLNAVGAGTAQAAFSVDMNGRKAADGRALVDMTFDTDEIGRRLDSSYFYYSGSPRQNIGGAFEGKLSLTLAELTSSTLAFDVKVLNQTKPNFDASIVSLWLGIAGLASAEVVNDQSDPFQRAQLKSNLPGRGTNAGVCIGVRGCGGNSVQANEGLLALSDSFRLNITGDFGVKDGTATGFGDAGFGVATLTDTGSKWKTHSSKGGYNVAGVPEPMTILGSGAALAFGALMKRRLSKKQA